VGNVIQLFGVTDSVRERGSCLWMIPSKRCFICLDEEEMPRLLCFRGKLMSSDVCLSLQLPQPSSNLIMM